MDLGQFGCTQDGSEDFEFADKIKWSSKLYYMGKPISEEIQIKRGIFQGDSLSPFLFLVAVNPVIRAINQLQFGISFGNNTLNEACGHSVSATHMTSIISMWALGPAKYSLGLINWGKSGLHELDQAVRGILASVQYRAVNFICI